MMNNIRLEIVNKVSIEEVQLVINQLNAEIDKTLLSFIANFNGSSGLIGKNYLMVYSINDIILLNQDAQKYIPGVLLFASDGGSEEFGIDYRDGFKYLRIPSIYCDYSDIVYIGESFDQFYKYIMEFEY